jgi:hypothetical protein
MLGNCKDYQQPTELLVYMGEERRAGMPCSWRVDFLCAACGLKRRTLAIPEFIESLAIGIPETRKTDRSGVEFILREKK